MSSTFCNESSSKDLNTQVLDANLKTSHRIRKTLRLRCVRSTGGGSLPTSQYVDNMIFGTYPSFTFRKQKKIRKSTAVF